MSRDPLYDILKENAKNKFDADRKMFMENAIESDDGLWTKHTEYHWSRELCGHRLDYWPSRKKFMWKNKVQRGDVMSFIRKTKGE